MKVWLMNVLSMVLFITAISCLLVELGERKTGNPKALQYHLGHNTPAMTLRYLSTLTQEDALKVQQEVEFK